MLNYPASLTMSTGNLKALPRKLDIKRHSHSILYLHFTSSSLIQRILQSVLSFLLSCYERVFDQNEDSIAMSFTTSILPEGCVP